MSQYWQVDPLVGLRHDHCYELAAAPLGTDDDSCAVANGDPSFIRNSVGSLLDNTDGAMHTSYIYKSALDNSDPMLTDMPLYRDRTNQQYSLLQSPNVSSTTNHWDFTTINELRPLDHGTTLNDSHPSNVDSKHFEISSNRFESYPFYCPSNSSVTSLETNGSSTQSKAGKMAYPLESRRMITVKRDRNTLKPDHISNKGHSYGQIKTNSKVQQLNRGHGFVNVTSPYVMNNMRLLRNAKASEEQHQAPRNSPAPLSISSTEAIAKEGSVPIPARNIYSEHTHDGKHSYMCEQSKAIVTRLLNFNKRHAKGLGEYAKQSIWSRPDYLTATMTGLNLATVRMCEGTPPVSAGNMRCTERKVQLQTTKGIEMPEKPKQLLADKNEASVDICSNSSRYAIKRVMPKRVNDINSTSNMENFTARRADCSSSFGKHAFVVPNILRRNYTNPNYILRSVVGSLVDSVCKDMISDEPTKAVREKGVESSTLSEDMTTVKREVLNNEFDKPTSSSSTCNVNAEI